MANNKVKIVVGFPANGGGGGAVDSVNGKVGEVVLDKSDLGLGNVDNTSDADKPISDATQSALDDLQQEIPNPNNLVNQFTTDTQGVSGRFTVQEPLDSNTSDAASVGYVLGKIGGGGDVINNFIQGAGADESFGFPFATVYSDNMQELTTSISSFNGGLVSYTQGNGYAEVTNTSSAKGFTVSFNNENDTDYILKLNIQTSIQDAEVRVLSQWSTDIKKINGSGEYFISYTSDPAPGPFGNKVVVTTNDIDNTDIKVFAVAIALPVDSSLIPTKDSLLDFNLDVLKSSESLVYFDDFRDNSLINYYKSLGGGGASLVYDEDNKLGNVNLNTNGILGVGYNNSGDFIYQNKKFVKVTLSISNLTSPIKIQPEYTKNISEIVSDGVYVFKYELNEISNTISLNRFFFQDVDSNGSSFDLNYISISTYDFNQEITESKKYVNIGLDAENSVQTTPLLIDRKGTLIGLKSKSDQNYATNIGYLSNSVYSSFFGGVKDNEVTALGELARALCWRSTALGAKSFAGGQSSTAIGAGATSYMSHEITLGRGSLGNWSPLNKVKTNNSIVSEGRNLILGNGHSHYVNTPPSRVSVIGTTPLIPKDIEVGIIGQCAYDGRFPLYDTIKSYSIQDKVREGDYIYNCIQGGVNKLPSQSPLYWELLTLGDGSNYKVPSSEGSQKDDASQNAVKGGHLYLQSGYGTGGQDGGEVRIYSTPSNGFEDDNEQSQKTLEAKFTSESTISNGSRFYLLDTSTGTLKRVEFGDDDSAGVGYKVLKVTN